MSASDYLTHAERSAAGPSRSKLDHVRSGTNDHSFSKHGQHKHQTKLQQTQQRCGCDQDTEEGFVPVPCITAAPRATTVTPLTTDRIQRSSLQRRQRPQTTLLPVSQAILQEARTKGTSPQARQAQSFLSTRPNAAFVRLCLVVVLSLFAQAAGALPTDVANSSRHQTQARRDLAAKQQHHSGARHANLGTVTRAHLGSIADFPGSAHVRTAKLADGGPLVANRLQKTVDTDLGRRSGHRVERAGVGSAGLPRGLEVERDHSSLVADHTSVRARQTEVDHSMGGWWNDQAGSDRPLLLSSTARRRHDIPSAQTDSTLLQHKNSTVLHSNDTVNALNPLPPILSQDPHRGSSDNVGPDTNWMLYYGSHVLPDGQVEDGVVAVVDNSKGLGGGHDAAPGPYSNQPASNAYDAPDTHFFSFKQPAENTAPEDYHRWLSNLDNVDSSELPSVYTAPVYSDDDVQPSAPQSWGPNPLLTYTKGSTSDAGIQADAAPTAQENPLEQRPATQQLTGTQNAGPAPAPAPSPASSPEVIPSNNAPASASAPAQSSAPAPATSAAPPAPATSAPSPAPAPAVSTNALMPEQSSSASATDSNPSPASSAIATAAPSPSTVDANELSSALQVLSSATYNPRPFPSRSSSAPEQPTGGPSNGTAPPPPASHSKHAAAIVLGAFAGTAFVVLLGMYMYRRHVHKQDDNDFASLYSHDGGPSDKYTSPSGLLARSLSRRTKLGLDVEQGFNPFDDPSAKVAVPPPARSVISTIRSVPRSMEGAGRTPLPLLPDVESSPRSRLQALANLAKPLPVPANVIPAQKRVPVPPLLASLRGGSTTGASDGHEADTRATSRRETASTVIAGSDVAAVHGDLTERASLDRRGSKFSDQGSTSGHSTSTGQVSHISYPNLAAMHRGQSVVSAFQDSPSEPSPRMPSSKAAKIMKQLRSISDPLSLAASPLLSAQDAALIGSASPNAPSVGTARTASIYSRHEGATNKALAALQTYAFPLPPVRNADAATGTQALSPLDISSPRRPTSGPQRTPSLAGIGAGVRYGVARHFISLLAGPVLAGRDQQDSSAHNKDEAPSARLPPPATPMTFNSPLFPWGDANQTSGAFASPAPPSSEVNNGALPTGSRKRPSQDMDVPGTPSKRQRSFHLRVTNLQ
ncbi:hypothetical protein OC861_001479 [Tilletia horrida]|nr:hypothetical protein OC861_001479 [Tilletia horrida]